MKCTKALLQPPVVMVKARLCFSEVASLGGDGDEHVHVLLRTFLVPTSGQPSTDSTARTTDRSMMARSR